VGPSCRREREKRGGELGWVGSGRSGPDGLPGAAQLGSWPLLLFYFFLLLSFSFILISVLSFEEFFYSDLNKIKADHFWSLKSVFRTINQGFCDKM
jgi:hypothetical protein